MRRSRLAITLGLLAAALIGIGSSLTGFARAADRVRIPAVTRSDGARLIPVSVPRGSLQNPCFAGGARLVLTWFSRGYNEGGRLIASWSEPTWGHASPF